MPIGRGRINYWSKIIIESGENDPLKDFKQKWKVTHWAVIIERIWVQGRFFQKCKKYMQFLNKRGH